jgi:hypothetical protein
MEPQAELEREPVYRPILPARAGELAALSHLDPATVHRIVPVLEVPASWRGPVRDAYLFFTRLRDRAPAGLRVAVDLRHLADPVPTTECRRHPAYDIGEDLAVWGVPMLPVIRPFDSDERLAHHGASAAMHGHGAVVRLRPRAAPWPTDTASAAVDRIARHTGLDPARCDLLLDLGQLDARRPLDPAVETAAQVVDWSKVTGWRSVTVAAGTMPPLLTRHPVNTAYRLDRREAELARRLDDRGINHLGYGDYGIASPSAASRGTGARWGPVPTLRYTAHDGTWIYRWTRQGGYDNVRFYDLCRELVDADHFAGGHVSWGDAELLRRAFYTPGPGTAASWIAWGTSHHLAHVLAERDAARTSRQRAASASGHPAARTSGYPDAHRPRQRAVSTARHPAASVSAVTAAPAGAVTVRTNVRYIE